MKAWVAPRKLAPIASWRWIEFALLFGNPSRALFRSSVGSANSDRRDHRQPRFVPGRGAKAGPSASQMALEWEVGQPSNPYPDKGFGQRDAVSRYL